MRNPVKKLLGRQAGSDDIEAEISRLERKLTDNEARRATALQALSDAEAARRNVLAEDDAVIEQASAQIRKAQLAADDITRLVDDYRTAISDARRRYQEAKQAEAVETTAARLDAIADQMDGVAPALQKAVDAVAAAVKAMEAILPADLAVFPTFNMHRPGDREENHAAYASRREAISAVVAEVLLASVPQIFDCYFDAGTGRVGSATDGYRASLSRIMNPSDPQPDFVGNNADFDGLQPAAAIGALVSDRARANARKIRAGDLEPYITAQRPTRPALSVVPEHVEEAIRAVG